MGFRMNTKNLRKISEIVEGMRNKNLLKKNQERIGVLHLIVYFFEHIKSRKCASTSSNRR